jgi:DtxR family Mn-dependent transcriptional regulator
MHRRKPLSDIHEMYLKTLYSIPGHHDVSRVADLADGLGVTPGTASSVLKKLVHLNLVDHEKYGFVALTETGSEIAKCVLRRFEIVRAVLIEVFGVDPKTASEDACMMEHAVSPVTVNRMKSLLERVRSGSASLPKHWRRPPAGDPCARCEARGVCQAAAMTAGG